jgi:hypothetical protein
MLGKQFLLGVILASTAFADGPLIEDLRGELRTDVTGIGGAGNYFGFSAAISGNRMLVSAPLEQGVHFGPGAVYVFKRTGGIWRMESKLLDPGSYPLGIDLDIDGSTCILGAPNSQVELSDTNHVSAGRALICVRKGSQWIQQARIEGDRDYARLGTSVVIDGDTIHVGVPSAREEPGEVRRYVRAGTNWIWQTTIQSDLPMAGDMFGRSMAKADGRLAVPSPQENAVYVYTDTGAHWRKEARLTPATPVEGVQIRRISWMDNDRIVADAFGALDAPGNPVDRLYLFARSGTNWLEEAVLTDPASTDHEDFFGWPALLHQGKLFVAGETATDDSFIQVFKPSGANWIADVRHSFGSSRISDLNHFGNELLIGMPFFESLGAVGRWKIAGPNWSQLQELNLGDGGDGHYFGFSISLDDDRVMVGAPVATPQSVYIFREEDTNWVREARLDGRGLWPHGFGFAFAVALSGDTALVGDPDVPENVHSRAVVYTRSGTNWNLEAELSPFDPETYERFGWAVALDGNTAMVGAPDMKHPGEGLTHWGGVRVFHRSGTNWNLQAQLVPESSFGGRDFGYALSLSGDSALVGAPDINFPNKISYGGALIFERFGTNWLHRAELIPARGDRDRFGMSVSLDGNRAAVGAPGVTVNGHDDAGCAYLYVRSGSNQWAKEARLIAPEPSPNADFGASVALCGDRVVVGAPNTGGHENSGRAYLFQRQGTNWIPRTIEVADISEDAWFGFAMALDDRRLFISSPLEHGADLLGDFSYQQGRVRHYDLVEPYPHWVSTQGLQSGLTDGLFSDPDGDGRPNFHEYATGSVATDPDSFAQLSIDAFDSGPVVRFTRNPDALDAMLVLECRTRLADSAAWVGVASNIWGQWSGKVEVVETDESPRTVEVPLTFAHPPHAAFRLDVRGTNTPIRR